MHVSKVWGRCLVLWLFVRSKNMDDLGFAVVKIMGIGFLGVLASILIVLFLLVLVGVVVAETLIEIAWMIGW